MGFQLKRSERERERWIESLITLMFAAVEEAEPLEAEIDVVLRELGGVELLNGNGGEFADSVFREQSHGFLRELHFFLRIDALAKLLFEDPVFSVSLLHARLHPGSFCLRRSSGGGEDWLAAPPLRRAEVVEVQGGGSHGAARYIERVLKRTGRALRLR